ncbi:zinc-binding alcohol dehydrogenase [Rathayibacter sp. YIM 133350]|uniref:zinc-binding alcohol dehydrogenase n=1 Tax=Rathayibacter sp. YIM 133350 TaxID=3131992 RepID=UPI00307E2714
MRADSQPSWMIREDASIPVLLVLWLRQSLGIASPAHLPPLRGVTLPARTPRDVDAQDRLERQWRDWWAMTVEPEAHPSPVPLQLIDGYDTALALPVSGAEDLEAAVRPLSAEAMTWARKAHDTYAQASIAKSADSYRAYAGTIAEHEREVGRRAHSFELNVQVLPLAERGVWWIGSLTVAVTDALRTDAAAFNTAIHPIIAEIA